LQYNVRFWSARVLFHRLACWNACQGRAVKRASIHSKGDKRCRMTQVTRLQQEKNPVYLRASLLRSRDLGCNTTLPQRGARCVTSQKTTAKEAILGPIQMGKR